MRGKLAIIHTTPVTIDPLKKLTKQVLPDCQVMNFVDDSILPQLLAGESEPVERRVGQYVKFAEEVGANVILSACSSIGEMIDRAACSVKVPVLRIDEAMAEKAVQSGSRIAVAATLSTTLQPTMSLLRQKALALGRSIELMPVLVNEAYHLLVAGKQAEHDALLLDALGKAAREVQIVVLAQASMARVADKLPENLKTRFLTSPQLGMEKVKQVFAALDFEASR